MHQRYMGGNGVIGEKKLCENMLRYDAEAPLLSARIEAAERLLAAVDIALNNPNMVLEASENPLSQKQELASANILKERMDKVVAIQKHARNIKELRTLRKRVSSNLAKVIAGEQPAENKASFSTSRRSSRQGGSRQA